MNISLDAVKSYCRVDGEEEDALLLSLVDAAKDYLEGEGVMEPEAEEPLYLLAVKALVLHYYDHRGLTESGAPGEIPGIRNAIVQLKLRATAARALEGLSWPTG